MLYLLILLILLLPPTFSLEWTEVPCSEAVILQRSCVYTVICMRISWMKF